MDRTPSPAGTPIRARMHPDALDRMSMFFDAAVSTAFVELTTALTWRSRPAPSTMAALRACSARTPREQRAQAGCSNAANSRAGLRSAGDRVLQSAPVWPLYPGQGRNSVRESGDAPSAKARSAPVAPPEFNCGSARGHSVREVLAEVAACAGVAPCARAGPRRPGDAAVSIAAIGWAAQTLGCGN